MLIISNNCIGGFCYKFTHTIYNNPFMFTMTKFCDFVPLITTQLNYGNFKLEKTDYESIKDQAYDIIVDNKVRIHFSHYRLSDPYEIPIRIGINIYGKYIYKYVVEKYISRAKRLCQLHEPMTFALSWHPTCGTVSDLCSIAKLCESTHSKYVVITPPLNECNEIFDTIPRDNIITSPADVDGSWVENTAKQCYMNIIQKLTKGNL